MSAASAADDEAQALPLLPCDVDAMLGIGTAHQALPVHVPARSREAGAEASTLTEAEAARGEAAAPGSASCLAGAVLALEDQRPAAAAVAKAAALAEPISN